MDRTAESLDTLCGRTSSEEDYTEEKASFLGRQRIKKNKSRVLFAVVALLGLSALANVGLVLVAYSAVQGAREALAEQTCKPPVAFYSPAQDVLAYKLDKFSSAVLDGKSNYQGPPTPENNAAWLDLYKHLQSHISPEEARLLPNKTAPEPDNEHYAVFLSVFHDLHCLDDLRLSLWFFLDPARGWNSTYSPYTLYSGGQEALVAELGHRRKIEHLDHCIDTLRQASMCQSDVTPNVVQWSEKTKDFRARNQVIRQCRDFEKVQQWAVEHHSPAAFATYGDGPELGKCGAEDPWTCLYE